MRHRLSHLLFLLLVPAVVLAAGILGYYTWRTASQFNRLGEQTIVQSTLLLVREKVDRVEQDIIAADNAFIELVELRNPSGFERAFLDHMEALPTLRAVLILDESGSIVAYATRAKESGKRRFRKLFLERILPDLELQLQPLGRLKHLHRNYSKTSYLLSYVTLHRNAERFYVVGHHDTDVIVNRYFPSLFVTEEGKRLYNVVDENNHRIFGPSLAGAGDYLVGHRFPTTLYRWRLQVAPKQAPLLDAKRRTSYANEAALVGSALAVLMLGFGFLLFAAYKERRVGRLKSDFIANVSHELKTPLSVIRMFADLLLTDKVPNERKKREYLATICRESERLSTLIENVLDFAALEQGRQRYDFLEHDAAQVLSDAIEAFRYRIEGKGTSVQLQIPDTGHEVRAVFDEPSVVLATVNLLDNAVKHGNGPVRVLLKSDKERLSIAVRDHGPGIGKDEAKRVFDRFYRAKAVGSTRGSGIGLSLVRHVAEAHGGSVWARSHEEGGAEVGFSIPTGRERKPSKLRRFSAIRARRVEPAQQP